MRSNSNDDVISSNPFWYVSDSVLPGFGALNVRLNVTLCSFYGNSGLHHAAYSKNGPFTYHSLLQPFAYRSWRRCRPYRPYP